MRLEALRLVPEREGYLVREEYSDGTHFDEGPYPVAAQQGNRVVLETATRYWAIVLRAGGRFHGSQLVPKELADSRWLHGR